MTHDLKALAVAVLTMAALAGPAAPGARAEPVFKVEGATGGSETTVTTKGRNW